jgi:hypothetical protein
MTALEQLIRDGRYHTDKCELRPNELCLSRAIEIVDMLVAAMRRIPSPLASGALHQAEMIANGESV